MRSFVAIHGISGDRILSWTDRRDRTGICWLRDLLPRKFPDADVLTFGYKDTVEVAADTLLGDLTDYVVNAGLIVNDYLLPRPLEQLLTGH
jgi:hypothetical protein